MVPKVTKLQNLGKKEGRHKFNFLHEHKNQSVLEAVTIVFGSHNQECPKYPKQQLFVKFFAAFLEPLVHHQNAAGLILFYKCYFGRCSSELAQLVPLPFSRGRSTRYSDRLHDFPTTIPRCYEDVHVNSFFPRTATLWNFLSIECFPLIYDISGFTSRINRHLLTVGSFKKYFLYAIIFFVLLFLVTPRLLVVVQPCME